MGATLLRDTDVLIIGAGPTGLVLALWLTRMGIRVRIIDKTEGPGTTSRALALQARTLEFYRQAGFGDEVERHGRKVTAVNLWATGSVAAQASFEGMGEGLSPYPFPLIFPQDEHERLLIEHLEQVGVKVERQKSLVSFTEAENCVLARMQRADGAREVCEAAYIAGCDGAHSTVREALGIGFPGGVYQHLFYVADVEASGAVMNGEIHVALDQQDFLAVFPLKASGRARLVGTVRPQAAEDHQQLSWRDVSQRVIDRMKIEVEKVNWFSTYQVHHRVAEHFRKGRVFLLGDAAHVHSPLGGQGMNTGIGDAVNLAWKLAASLSGHADESVLESYEPERIAFARRLVATTDKAFTGVTSNGTIARWMRLKVVPLAMPFLFKSARVRRFLFRTVSQTSVNYRGSGLSEGRAGSIYGGDRLPWVPPQPGGNGRDNFKPLTSMDWQIHVYGEATPSLRQLCEKRQIALHAFPWQANMAGCGLRRDAMYLVRPDGYVGLASTSQDAPALMAYLNERSITPLLHKPIYGANRQAVPAVHRSPSK